MSSSSFNTDIFYQAGGADNDKDEEESDTCFTLSKDRLNRSVDNSVSVHSYLFSQGGADSKDTEKGYTDTYQIASKLQDVHEALLSPGYTGVHKGGLPTSSPERPASPDSVSTPKKKSGGVSSKSNRTPSTKEASNYSFNTEDFSCNPSELSSNTRSTVRIPTNLNLTKTETVTNLKNKVGGGRVTQYSPSPVSTSELSGTRSYTDTVTSSSRHEKSIVTKHLDKQFKK